MLAACQANIQRMTARFLSKFALCKQNYQGKSVLGHYTSCKKSQHTPQNYANLHSVIRAFV